jgi:amidophosphoribosyltransferase
MDTGTRTQLLAADLTVDEVRDYLGCDTLAYLELDRLMAATGAAGSGFCTACLTGEYPVDVPLRRRRSGEEPEALPDVDLVHPCG